MKVIEIDNALCEGLILHIVNGESERCKELTEYLWPIWLEMLSSSRQMQTLVNVEDGVHDVALRLVEKLGHPEGSALRLFLPWKERTPEKTFADWMRIVISNTIRDYVRQIKGRHHCDGEEPSLKRVLNEFATAALLEELGNRPPYTWAQTARELFEFARQRLPDQQLVVLEAWLQGASFREIAATRQLTPEATRQMLRAAVAVLRRQFADMSPLPPDGA